MSRPKAQTVLLSAAIILALLGTAGGAAMLVHGRLTAEHVFDKARALAEQQWHHDNAMEAVRASVPGPTEPDVQNREGERGHNRKNHRSQVRPRPVSHNSLHAPHGKRQPGDDSANELNRDFIAGR